MNNADAAALDPAPVTDDDLRREAGRAAGIYLDELRELEEMPACDRGPAWVRERERIVGLICHYRFQATGHT